MSNPLINKEENIIYLSKVVNIKYSKETLKQINRMKKTKKRRK